MSLVKWAHINFLWGLPVRSPEYVPVIPLSALREVVEGLRKLRDDMLILQMDGCECNSCKYYRLIQHLLTQLREET